MTVELHQLNWLRAQWRRFRSLLLVAVSAVWLLCSAGILWILRAGKDEFLVPMALLAMLLVSTGLAGRLLWVIRRELRALEQQALEARATEADGKATEAGRSGR
jgi:hypothetical protein